MLALFMPAQIGSELDWLPVPLQPGHVAVLGGHTLEFATAGVLRATHHHVVVRRSPAICMGGQDQHTLGITCGPGQKQTARRHCVGGTVKPGLPPAGMLCGRAQNKCLPVTNALGNDPCC